MSKVCYNRGFYRDRRWQTVVRRALGVPMDVRQIQEGLSRLEATDPQAAEALKACRILLVEIAQGRLSLMRNPWGGRR